MNQFDKILLKKAYDNYTQTGSSSTTHRMLNSNDFIYYISSARSLDSRGLIVGISSNIFKNSINPFDNFIEYELTEEGLSYIKENLKR